MPTQEIRFVPGSQRRQAEGMNENSPRRCLGVKASFDRAMGLALRLGTLAHTARADDVVIAFSDVERASRAMARCMANAP